MSEPLAGVSRVYLDANIFIYFVEGQEPHQSRAAAALKAIDSAKIHAITSQLAMAECLYGVFKQGKAGLEADYRQIFQDIGMVAVAPVTADVFEAAARLGRESGLKLLDCIHIAAAEIAGCEALLTNDGRFRSRAGLRVINLAAAEF